MGSNGNRVKQLLATARLHHRPEALQDAVEELLTAEGKTGTASTELRVLGAEVAIELQQWATASQLLRAAGASNETRLLRIRRVLCGVLVSMHDVDDQETLSAEEKVQEKLNGMTTVLQTVADAVEMWPDSVDAVLIGIRTLWAIISPLLDAGRHAEVCDAVVFLASLHQQLHIGGGYTLVQWMARSGLCLYAADRVGEAFAHFSTAMDAAAILSNQRLYVQLLRMSASVVSAKERAAASAKGRSEFLGAYRSRPVVYGVLLTQLIFTGVMDVENCRDELHSTYETIHSGNSEVVLPAEVGAAVGKNKKKPPATKQQAPPTRMTETFTVTDPDVVDEVKSDLLLCISLFDTLTPQQLEELERKRHSSNRRVRSFTAFALYLHEGRERGVTVLQTCADASVLRPSHHVDANYFVQNVLSVLKTTDAIHDESERQYTLHVGVTLLWNHLLPVLQSSFAAEVQPAMDVILAAAEAAIPQLRPLFLQIGLQQCHIAYNEDHRATLHHLLPLLQRECARDAARSPNSQLQFALQWMQHQLAILEEPESSLTCQADRCLFAIEQARTVSNPTKRIPFLKAAFQHLPLLVREEPPPEAVVRDAPKKQSGHNAPQQQQQQQQQQQAAAPTQAAPSLRRSTVQLYKELLDLCMEDLSPSLYTVASTVADALRSLPGPPPGLSADDLEELQATASLHSATLLWRQLEDEADSVADKTGAKSARRTREALLAGLLKETAQRAAALEGRRGGSGSWIVANACLTFLAMKQRDYLAGNYSMHMAELLELHSSYAALFVRGRAQDVALLSDLTVAAVVGLLAGFVATKAAAVAAVAPTSPASPVRSGSTAQQEASYAALIRRIQACVTVESSNPQLRKAETLCREGLQLIPAPRHKWFLAMLFPTVLRLANEKPVVAIHPQEELLFHLGVLAGPALTPAERQALQEQEMWPLLRRDPSVRLCAWVAALAAEMQLEEAVLECCQIADSLYAEGRLGWDSNCDVVRSTGALGAAGGVGAAGRLGENGTAGSGTAALGATLSSMNGIGNKKVSMSMVLVQREATQPVKPDMDDWGAYAQLLAMKTRVCANHLQGLSGDVRRVALQQLFTNCVNSVIAVIHGPPAARAEHFTRAFSAYYSIVRDNNSVVPLSEAGFILPSLRMLLSKAILTQIPKREWSATFTELVYQLGAILVYVSYSSGRDDDVQQLTTHLRLLRELLPPRYQKSLRVRETTEVCYRNPTVDGFLHVSRNMEVEVQAHGWLIVAQRAGDEASAAEAFALALAGTQTNAFARAQCLFEFAYTSLQRGSAPLARAAAQLREALRTLEGLPESAALLHDTASDADSTKATLADKSLTASFLRTCRKRGPTSEVTATTREQQAVARAALSKKAANAAKGPHVNFQHLLLGLRIVALLFRVASPSPPHATGTGSAAVKASRSVAPATRRDCANVMLDYIASLWELCAKTLRDEEELAAVSQRSDRTVAGLILPESATQFHGFTEAAGMAQRVRKLVPDEELQLNTQGVWQTVLELGDYLAFTGDEAHAFMVYAWLRFSAEMSLGGPESSAACAQVHRVCNLRMSIASVMGGLSDAPYKAALQRLSEVHLPLERHALVAPQRAGAPSPQAWLVAFVVAECEARVVLGQIEEAAALSLKFLVSDTHKDALSDAELHGLRIVAHNEIVRGRHDEALRMVDEALHGMQSHRSAFEPNGHFAVDTWIKLCDVKLRALLNKKAGKEAVQWLVAVRGQLTEWRAAAALASKTANTLHTIGLQAELSNAVQYWARELMDCAFHSNPSAAALQAFPVAEGPVRGAALEIYREVLAITEDAETLHIRLYRAAAQWRLRDRVSPRWAAQHASLPKEHLCPRLMTLLAEKKALHLLRESVEAVMPQQREGDAGRPVATSFGLWRAFLLYWEAVGHLEANHVVECLLSTFRQLSMHDLQLPTTDAPPHLEKEVLRFIRGGMEEEKAADADAAAAASATAASSPTRARVGARWQHTPKVAMAEMEQALQHYGMPIKEATAVADLSTVLPLVDRALAMARPWSHSRLACAFLNTCAEIEVLRLAENQIPAADDMVGEKLESQREAVITAAWNRAPLIPPKTDKANNRSRKSISSLRQRGSNEASLTLTAPMLSSAEQDMLQRVKDGAEEAVRHMHIDMAEMLYDSLGNLAILLGRPRFAAAAAEQMQACQLVGLLHAKSTQEMADCAEGRLWRQYASLHPLLRGASPCRALLEDVLSLSPMGRYIRSCATLCVEEKKDDEVIPPSSHGRDAAPVEASPFVVDAPVLTIALSTLHPSTCLVLLRHTDGAVEGRRRALAESEWRLLVRQVEEVQSHTAELLGSDKGGRLGSAAQRITSEDAASVLDPLAPTTSKLLLDFQPSLQSSGAKSPLYLCLGPGVQAFAWEQTSVLAACSVVVRELSAAVVVSKYNEPSRAVRRPSTHNTKSSAAAPPKSVAAGPSVCIVDAFGDHTESIENVFNGDSAKLKNTQHIFVTCSEPGSPPDPCYVAWVLNASAPSSMVVDMCGSFADVLPLSHLATLRLSQLNVAVMADGAVNVNSRQREERKQLGGGSADSDTAAFAPPRWLVQLVLLVRGARFVVANTFPCSPEASDGLTRRCLSSLASAKALVEQLRGKAKDTKTPLVTLYGAFGNTGKQKA